MKEEIRKTYNENGIVWFRCTEKFSEELHKYINTHNESTTILVYSKEDSMWMEETYTGKWMGKKFKMIKQGFKSRPGYTTGDSRKIVSRFCF